MKKSTQNIPTEKPWPGQPWKGPVSIPAPTSKGQEKKTPPPSKEWRLPRSPISG